MDICYPPTSDNPSYVVPYGLRGLDTFGGGHRLQSREGGGVTVPRGRGGGRREAKAPPAARRPLSTVQNWPRALLSGFEGGGFASLKFTGRKSAPVPRGGGRLRWGFSAGARRRMQVRCLTLNRNLVDAGQMVFVTLTWRSGVGRVPPTAAVLLRCRDIMRKRFDRRLGAGWRSAGVSRVEFQRSGWPHLHFLLVMPPHFGVSALAGEVDWWARNWAEVSADPLDRELVRRVHSGLAGSEGSRSRPCVEVVRSWNGVAAYVSKYIAKVVSVKSQAEEAWRGRHWHTWGLRFMLQKGILAPRSAVVSEAVAVDVRRAWRRLGRKDVVGFKVALCSRDWSWGCRFLSLAEAGRVVRGVRVLDYYRSMHCRVKPVFRRCRVRDRWFGASRFVDPVEFERMVTVFCRQRGEILSWEE